jgi:energy-coupling factor transporter ATP-binding protein EcfA2
MDAFRESLSTPRTAIDALADVLERRFDLVDARAQAQVLLDPALLDEARELHRRALLAQRDAIDGKHTLNAIEKAAAEFKRTAGLIERIEGWHRLGLDRLALDLFVLAPNVAGACDPGWRPSAPASIDTRPIYLRTPKLRFADHFEPDIDLLIVDHRLGTLALVQWLEFDDRPAQEQVREHVDRATYLRHLLVGDQGSGRQTFTVELVLVHPAAEPGSPGFAMLAAIGELLRELALDTDCLHATGINLLPCEDARTPSDDELRRAFPWLLRDSRRWFAALARQAEPPGDSRLARIELDEYRLAGLRRLELHPSARLHLLHGHNGSGKSSLVEALELMLTGRIERLSGIDDYEQVIRNRHAGDRRASVKLVDRGGHAFEFALSGPVRPAPLAPGSRAASFRLDQTVMDRLARASEVDRAAELLAAFFAEEAAVRERWRVALADARRQIEQLPERLRQWLGARRRERQELHEVVVEQFGALAEGRLRPELVDAMLPVELGTLMKLRGQLPALGLLEERLRADGSIAIDDPIFTSLEFELGGLVGELGRRHGQLVAAGRALERAGRWWQDTAHPHSADDFAEAVDEWLELGALGELAERQQTILTALVNARAQGWDDRRLDEAGPAGELLRTLARTDPATIEALAQARGRWERRRAELGAVLDRKLDPQATTVVGGPVSAARVRLDEDEVAALDELGRWLSEVSEGLPLGQRIRQAIEHESPTSFAGRAIGPHQWAQPLREQVADMLHSLVRLRDAASEAPMVAAAPPLEMELEEADELSDFVGTRYDRDEDAPRGAIRDRDSIGELPITIEESAAGEFDDFVALQDGPEPEPEQAEKVEQAKEVPNEEEAEQDDDEPGPFERLTRSLLGRKKHPERERARSDASPPASTPPPKPSPAMAKPAAAAPAVQRSPNVAAGAVAAPSVRKVAQAPASEAAPPPVEGSFAPPIPRPEPAPAKPAMRIELQTMLERLRRAHVTSLEAAKVGAEVRESFVARLAANDEGAMGLVDALNELMALFTPARWAYEDVLLRYEEDGDAPRLQFETGNQSSTSRSRADLRLNTAQLNAFVLALFLLCAPRVSNPLGLLVLDDPLQNMDELTVTTLARGLAKLLRVMPQRWTLMMLFHGEGDLARFHDEVECGVYLLPWLSPTQRGSEIVIQCRPQTSRLGLTMQRLVGFVSLRP